MRTEISSILIYYAPKVSFLDHRCHKRESELVKLKNFIFIFQNLAYFTRNFIILISQKEILNSGKICLFSPMATNA